MFTGLVESLGTVHQATDEAAGRCLRIVDPTIAADAPVGASIAINGACLTVVARADDVITFQAGPETLQKTNLGTLRAGDRVNLERALRVGDRLGGHLVQGHVDGVGTMARREPQGEWDTVWFQCPEALARYLIPKGSVAVDGVSLTLVDVLATGFSVALIPHTLALTTLGFKKAGATVNLEVDQLAKYVAKFVALTK
jgi:riboflavin synthase